MNSALKDVYALPSHDSFVDAYRIPSCKLAPPFGLLTHVMIWLLRQGFRVCAMIWGRFGNKKVDRTSYLKAQV